MTLHPHTMTNLDHNSVTNQVKGVKTNVNLHPFAHVFAVSSVVSFGRTVMDQTGTTVTTCARENVNVFDPLRDTFQNVRTNFRWKSTPVVKDSDPDRPYVVWNSVKEDKGVYTFGLRIENRRHLLSPNQTTVKGKSQRVSKRSRTDRGETPVTTHEEGPSRTVLRQGRVTVWVSQQKGRLEGKDTKKQRVASQGED